MPWVGLQCVILVFHDHTHLLFCILCWLVIRLSIPSLSISFKLNICTLDFINFENGMLIRLDGLCIYIEHVDLFCLGGTLSSM